MGMGPSKDKKTFIIREVLEIGVILAGETNKFLGAAVSAAGMARNPGILPNPHDYDQLNLDMAKTQIDIARDSEVDLHNFVDVINDVNITLEEQGLNIINAYVISEDDLKNLAEGKISIADISDKKTDPAFVLSEINDDNKDKTEVMFYREPDEYTGKSFLENFVIQTYGQEEDK